MQTEAAIVWELNTPWSVETIELDPPKEGEVLVKMAASGLCHSDDHVVVGDLSAGAFPMVGGHEGAGVIQEVGPGVTEFEVGDHVVFGFLPACGRCPSCVTGHSNMCDSGAQFAQGRQTDGTSRHHAGDTDLNLMGRLGTFAHHTVVGQNSCVKIDKDIPLELACLVGCGVTTGYGSAVYAGEVSVGDSVAVIGVGGLGANAIQGARLAGAQRIFAIDPVPFKQEKARTFGATHTAASVTDAFALIQEVTWGRMCNKVICTMDIGRGSMMQEILALTAKRGRVVVTNIHPQWEMDVTLNLCELTLMEKQIVGTIYGSANIRYDIPKLLSLYRSGHLDLEGLITKRYSLEEVNQGYADMKDGKNIRGVLVYP